MLDVEDIIKLHYNQIGDFSVAADDSMVAYVIGNNDVAHIDYMNDISNRALRLVNLRSKHDKEIIPNTLDGHSPAFSHTCKHLAFLGRDQCKTQVYIYDLAEDKLDRVTEEKYDCLNAFDCFRDNAKIFWSPNDKKLAILFFPNGNRYYLTNIAPKLQQEITVKSTNVSREKLAVHTRILIVDVETGLTQQLLQDNTRGVVLHGFIDENNLLITIDGKITKINVSTGQIHNVYHVSKKFLKMNDLGLFYADVDGDKVEFGRIYNENAIVTATARVSGESIKPVDISIDGSVAYFVYNKGLFSYLVKLLPSGDVCRMTGLGDVVYEPGIQAQPKVLKNGKVACVISNFKTHHELYVVENRSKEKLTVLNSIVENCNVRVDVTSFKSEGTDVETIIVLPEGYDDTREYPALIYFHGGPHNYVYGNLTNLINARAESVAISLAQEGFIVALPAYRGSRGYGKKFLEHIRNPVTDLEVGYLDAIACREHLITNYNADESRFGIYGSSYGASITAWTMTHSELFACGVGIIGVNYDQIFFNKLASSNKEFWVYNQEQYKKFSIVEYVQNIQSPFLIIETGEAEGKNFAGQVFFNALVAHDKQAEWVKYPNAFHGGGWTDEYKMDYINRMVSWFNTNLCLN